MTRPGMTSGSREVLHRETPPGAVPLAEEGIRVYYPTRDTRFECRSRELLGSFQQTLRDLLKGIAIDDSDGASLLAAKITNIAQSARVDLSCSAVRGKIYFVFQEKTHQPGYYYVSPDEIRKLRREIANRRGAQKKHGL
ncbi:MAG: hypothetical protein HY978_04265 [Candidatus Liptonbacteria bacterium]|nr:hypothetical protein [Candidatus Liptonbacteria bacterium]